MNRVAQAEAAPATTRHVRLSSIQRIRGYAAVLVLIAHACDLTLRQSKGFNFDGFGYLENFGAIGVDVFFVISGFVMAWSVSGKSGIGASRDFLVLRWVRIAPPYFIISFAVVLLLALTGSAVKPNAILNVILFVPFFDATQFTTPPVSVGWTLSFEFTFYLFVAIAVALRLGDKIGWLAMGIVGLVVAGLLLPDESFLLSWFTNPIYLEFVLGIGAYMVWKKGLTQRFRWLWLGAGVGAAAWLLAQIMFGYGAISEAEFTIDGTLSVQRVIWWGVPSALIVLAAVAFERKRQGPFARAAGAVGNASYSIYLVHSFALLAYGLVLTRTGVVLPPFVLLFSGVLVGLFAGFVYYRIVEKPITTRLQKYARSTIERSLKRTA